MNIAVIGAGAAGLFLATQLSADARMQVYVLERSAKIGTKLKASGGGKANILNQHICGECYNNAPFVNALLSQVDVDTILQAFANMGLCTIADNEGRMYPASLYAPAVVDVLCANMGKNVRIITECELQQLFHDKWGWHINNIDVVFDYVVLATGSPAGMISKNRVLYNGYLSALNIRVNAYKPSLVGFKIKNYHSSLYGCRARAILSLHQRDKMLFKELGEITFKEDGISGIVVLNASSYYNRLKNKENCYFILNFMYQNEHYNVQQHAKRYGSLNGLVHPKINDIYMSRHIDVQNYRMEIAEPYDYEYAQVCTGGISTQELAPNFELIKHPHLYAIGEMVDIDGVCGGYNLFFAFASAYKVAQDITHGNKNSQYKNTRR